MKYIKLYDVYSSNNEPITGMKIYENIIDIKNLKIEFLEKWNIKKPNSLKKLNKFLKELETIKIYNTNVNVNKLNIEMIEHGYDSIAEFIPNHKPILNIYLNYRDIEKLKDLRDNIEHKILIMLGHELLHLIQWKKGAYIRYNIPFTDQFHKMSNKCLIELDEFKKLNEINRENYVKHLLQKSNDYELMAWAYTIIQRLLIYYGNVKDVSEYLKDPKNKEINIDNLDTLEFFFIDKWPKELQKKNQKFRNYCYNYLNLEGKLNHDKTFKEYISDKNKSVNEHYNCLKRLLEI